MRQVLRHFLLAAATGLAACGTESAAPTAPVVSGVAGAYHAISLTSTKAGVTVDHLAQGIDLDLTLATDSSMSGEFTNVDATGALATLDLTGTWSFDGTTVTVADQAGSFVSNVPFTVVGDELRGESINGLTTFRIVLRR